LADERGDGGPLFGKKSTTEGPVKGPLGRGGDFCGRERAEG